MFDCPSALQSGSASARYCRVDRRLLLVAGSERRSSCLKVLAHSAADDPAVVRVELLRGVRVSDRAAAAD